MMETAGVNPTPPDGPPKVNGCLIFLLLGLVVLLIGWSYCGQELGR